MLALLVKMNQTLNKFAKLAIEVDFKDHPEKALVLEQLDLKEVSCFK